MVNHSHEREKAMNEGSFVGVGGLRIFTRSWEPADGNPRAVVVIVHGFNSHSGHYLWVGEQFANNGLAAHALDLRGRGKSDGERYHVDKAQDYVDDVATFVRMAKSAHPGLPVFLLGHSAGGVISSVYTLDHQDEIDGFICESFAHQLPAPEIALAVLKGLSHIVPNAHVLKLDNNGFSRDPKVVEALNNDPLIDNEVQPTETVATLIRADERLKREFSRITLPVFIMHGTEDKVTKPSGSQEFYDQAGSTDKTLKLYEGHYHDLLNDIDKEVVMADIVQWIDARIPAAQERGV
jgi:acylglycerol lipase